MGGHVPLNQEEYGFKNWAGAVFTTPSIYYACHEIYSIEFESDSEVNEKAIKWLPVVHAKLRKDSFTKHDHPFHKRYIEFKHMEMKDLIYRNENESDVQVVSLIFVNKEFLEKSELSYE